jgi:hypothetical protein
MNLKNTHNKRREIVQNAKLNNFDPSARIAIRHFEDWQRRVFVKNAKRGWRFFQPDSIDKPTPRSAREAWGGTYHKDDFTKKEDRNLKILLAIVTTSLIILSVI